MNSYLIEHYKLAFAYIICGILYYLIQSSYSSNGARLALFVVKYGSLLIIPDYFFGSSCIVSWRSSVGLFFANLENP